MKFEFMINIEIGKRKMCIESTRQSVKKKIAQIHKEQIKKSTNKS